MRTPVRMRVDVPAAETGLSPPHSGRVHPVGSGSRSARETRRPGVDSEAPLRQRSTAQRGPRLRGDMGERKQAAPASSGVVEFKPNGVQTAQEEWEDEARKRDPLLDKKLRVLAFILYLVVFVAVSLGARPTVDIYDQNAVLQNLLVLRVDEDSGIKQQQLGIAWLFITTEDDLWMYLEEGLAPGLMGGHLVPGSRARSQADRSSPLELLTGFQIRQLRVAADECPETHFTQAKKAVIKCTPRWVDGVEETAPFGPGGQWTHTKDSGLGADASFHGFDGLYDPGGYIVKNVSTNVTEFVAMVQHLKQNLWIDRHTRAVIIDINVWNPATKLITPIKMLAEFSVVGKIRCRYQLNTFEYKKFVDTERTYWWWELAYAILVCVYAFEEAWGFMSLQYRATKAELGLPSTPGSPSSRMRRLNGAQFLAQQRRTARHVKRALEEYTKDPWNLMDWLNYVCAGCVIFLELLGRSELHDSAEALNSVSAEWSTTGNYTEGEGTDLRQFFGSPFVSFFRAGQLSTWGYTLMGVNAVITWAKVLKYLNLFPHISMLSITLRNAAFPVMSFSIMFSIVFLSCGQAFQLAFGPFLRDFSTFGQAMMSLFRALLGDFDYEAIEQADGIVGPILFTLFIFLVLFVLLNMFIAILTEAYEKAKVEVFGDAVHEREEAWVGAVPFLEYTRQCLAYTVAALLPGKRNVFRQLKEIITDKGYEKAGFTEWLAAKEESQQREAAESGLREKGDEVNEEFEMSKAAGSQPVYSCFLLADHGTVLEKEWAVQLVVGTYGLSVLQGGSCTSYLYAQLKSWKFDPKGSSSSGSGGGGGQRFHLVMADTDEEVHFATAPTRKGDAMTICTAMMQNAMLEQQDTFSTTVALKVLRLEMEQNQNLMLSMIRNVSTDIAKVHGALLPGGGGGNGVEGQLQTDSRQDAAAQGTGVAAAAATPAAQSAPPAAESPSQALLPGGKLPPIKKAEPKDPAEDKTSGANP